MTCDPEANEAERDRWDRIKGEAATTGDAMHAADQASAWAAIYTHARNTARRFDALVRDLERQARYGRA